MMIRSSRRGRARETARGSADGLTGLIEPASGSEQRLGCLAGLVLGSVGGSLESSRRAASQQLRSFRGTARRFFVGLSSKIRTCDVCSWTVGCPASDDSIHCAGTSGMIGFRLVFSRWYRGGVKSQFNPAQSNQTKPNEPLMSLSWVVAGVPVGGRRVSGQQGRRGR